MVVVRVEEKEMVVVNVKVPAVTMAGCIHLSVRSNDLVLHATKHISTRFNPALQHQPLTVR